MPLNKEALIRYRVINRLLCNRKFVTLQEMIEACEEALDRTGIGARTIAGDIHAMRYDRLLNFEAPISFSHEKKAYYYDDPGYSIDRLPVTDEEIRSLMFAAAMLDQYSDVEIFNQTRGTIQKIVDALKVKKASRELGAIDFIEFEKATETLGREYLSPLIDAIACKKVVTVEYQAFDREKPIFHTLHPYLLKQFWGRWYLIGYNDYWQGIRTYALDRFRGLETKGDKPFRRVEFSPEAYYRNIFGISHFTDEKPPRIVLKVTKHQSQYMLTQPVHDSQRLIEERDNHLYFSLDLHPTIELKMLILSWGKEVEIMQPASLRRDIMDILDGMLKEYATED